MRCGPKDEIEPGGFCERSKTSLGFVSTLRTMATSISIHSELVTADVIRQSLSAQCEADGIRLRVEKTRSAEAALLIAIVGAAGTGLGALITGILKLAAEKGSRRIIIQGKSGRRIELPADAPTAEIERIVIAAKDLDVDRITF